ncbi:hypothetical protein K2173_024197 [Erythroxylum novogranatense]|uniref:Uncharacterized protein n=1 Tax=Erythroxylum novogranatense TaxID=1862640 RepID=A0AAV8UCF4_9ROSI|nr:hypothetical protein K2173_024197 [Erythroxylum novogranatense]
MQSIKETASNIAASAKAGMEKTKATVQEKVEKMSTSDPVQKEMATEKKEDRKAEAEFYKREARLHNAAASAPGGHGHYTRGSELHTYSTSGTPGYPDGTRSTGLASEINNTAPGHGDATTRENTGGNMF